VLKNNASAHGAGHWSRVHLTHQYSALFTSSLGTCTSISVQSKMIRHVRDGEVSASSSLKTLGSVALTSCCEGYGVHAVRARLMRGTKVLRHR